MSALLPAFQKDEALLADIRRTAAASAGFSCWWLGQSGFLIQWQGQHLLLDPYLSDSLTRKYANTDKPHVRLSECAIDPSRLDFIDVVTSSHNHTDHLDAETLLPLLRVNPALKLVIPEANRDFVAGRLHCASGFPYGLDAGQSLELHGFRFTAVPAAHEAIDRDEQGRCHYLGYVISFGGFTIYHSGDTVRYEGMEELLRPFEVDLALLPINGRDPARRVAGNLSAREAAELGKAIGAGCVIPCHYDMFAFNTADPGDFAAAAEALGQPFRVLRIGEGMHVNR